MSETLEEVVVSRQRLRDLIFAIDKHIEEVTPAERFFSPHIWGPIANAVRQLRDGDLIDQEEE